MMDFDYKYTPELERFRQEVRTWVAENIPAEMKMPVDSEDLTQEQYRFWRDKHKEMAVKGWLFPTLPKEYGGGGLSAEHDAILQMEFRQARVRGTFTVDFVSPSLLVWATEEQKQKFLVPILNGDKVASMKFTEPRSGTDVASYASTAVRDGDDWVLNGSNAFITGPCQTVFGGPDLLYGPLVTDPDAPRHRNLGYFMIPNPSPGLELRPMPLLSGREQHFVFLNNVRLSSDHLIGGDHNGWQVANTTLDKEHGGQGQAAPLNIPVNNLVAYMHGSRQKGESPGSDAVLQQRAIEAYLDAQIEGLFLKRTYWLYGKGEELTWEGPETFYFQRISGTRRPGLVRDVMGMYALLGSKDPLAPQGAAQEVYQRSSFIHMHGAGSLNITKVLVARRIGISRTKDRAAISPMTMAKRGIQ